MTVLIFLFIFIFYLAFLFFSWMLSSGDGIIILSLALLSTPLYLLCGKEIGFEACFVLTGLGLFVLHGVIFLILKIIETIIIPLWNLFCGMVGWKKYMITKKDPFGLSAL